MREPATAQLGRSKSGLNIGYRLLDMARSQVQPFTRKGVTETLIPGTYAALVDTPAQGGYIVWGTAEQDMAEAPISPTMPMPDPMPAMRQALDLLMQQIRAAMPGTPVVQMDTQPFEDGVSELRQVVGDQVTEIYSQLATLRESVDHLNVLNNAASYTETLGAMRDRITEILGDQAPIVRLMTDNTPSELASVLETVRRDVDRLTGATDTVTTQQAAKEKVKRQVAVLDELIAKMEDKR